MVAVDVRRLWMRFLACSYAPSELGVERIDPIASSGLAMTRQSSAWKREKNFNAGDRMNHVANF